MDPATLSNTEWTGIANMLTNLWVMLLLIVNNGSLYLAAHALIPSLVASHHLPEWAQRVRIPLYALLFVGIALYGYFLYVAIVEAGVIREIYDTFWIKGGAINLETGGSPSAGH